MKRKSTNAIFVSIFIAAVVLGFTIPAGADVPNPIVTGPIPVNVPLGDPSHDYPQFATQLDLASYGYVEEEFFLEGFATSYTTPPLADGEPSARSTSSSVSGRGTSTSGLTANRFRLSTLTRPE